VMPEILGLTGKFAMFCERFECARRNGIRRSRAQRASTWAAVAARAEVSVSSARLSALF